MIPAELASTVISGRAYADGHAIDEAFRTIRAQMPLDIAQPEGFDPFWVVSRRADLMEIERQPDAFHAGDKSTFLTSRENAAVVKSFTSGDPNLVRSLVSIDGEEHRDLRAIAFPTMTMHAVKKLETDIRVIARDAVDQMLALDGQCDFARDVAFLYPLRVIMTVLGVPREDERFMLRLTQELFGSADPEMNRSGREVTPREALEGLKGTVRELERYFGEVTRKFRLQPTQHVNSLIANAKINGEYLNQRQMMGYYIIAATAGHDTTSHTTSGAMWALAEHPELLAQLQQNPEQIGPFVEEAIRWVVPVKHFMRTATRDIELGGQKIAKDDWLMLAFHSANRDEAAFEAPFEFRLDRRPNKQVAFGYGVHVCLGQHLARLEMKILWEELIPRLKSVELAGTPRRTISNFVCGPKHVPIRFAAA